MPYIGTSPSNGVRRVHTYTATASQTTFSGASSEGVTLSYVDTNYIDVFQNGVLLGSADYTSTSGTSVVLAQGASVDDLIVIVVYDVFSVVDTVSKTNGGTFDNGITIDEDGATVLTVDRATSDGTIIDLQKDGTSIGNIGIASSTNDIFINSVASNHKGLRFGSGAIVPTTNSAGTDDNATNLGGASQRFLNIYLGGGIFLGGTGSANLLDDYEEGTWSPSLSQYAGSPSFQDSFYRKIGSFVVCSTIVDLDGTSDTSAMAITNVPFVARNTTNSIFGGFLSYTTSTYQYPIRVLMSSNGTQANLYEYAGSTLNYNEFGNNKQGRFMFFFFT